MIVRRLKTDELYHHGIKGQKWGVRRYQNPDGSLTDLGRKKYLKQIERQYKRPFYQGNDKERYEWNQIRNNTEFGKKVLDSKSVLNSIKQFKKISELNNYIENMKHEDSVIEYENFEKKLKKAGIKYTGDELHWSINQMVCVNHGIDPRKYAKELSKAQEQFSEQMEKETSKYFDRPNIKDPKLKDRVDTIVNKMSDTSILVFNKTYCPDMYTMFAYKEDNEILKKLLNTK